jgi:thiamine-phosphate diphosphorylase
MAIVASAEAGLRAASRATVLQLRAPQLTTSELEREAMRLTGASPVPVVISSRLDVCLAADGAGVNLPERDISAADARKLLGERLIGRSVHTLESAVAAEREGADYVLFGPVWSSQSHPGLAPVGLESLAQVAQSLRIPVLAIGGVTVERIPDCDRAGAAGYAAIGMYR